MSDCGTGQKHRNPVLSSDQGQDETGAQRGETQLWGPFHYSKLKTQISNRNICFHRRDWPHLLERYNGRWHRGISETEVCFLQPRVLRCSSLWPVLSTNQPAQPGPPSATSQWNPIGKHRKMQRHQIRHAANACTSVKGQKGTSLMQPRRQLPSSWGSKTLPKTDLR